MPALNFQKQFVPMIRSGAKLSTIRAPRKIPIQAGDKLYLYYGQRTKACEKIGETICTREHEIRILESCTIKIDGQAIYPKSAEKLANKDGFVSLEAMMERFRNNHALPLFGQIIYWQPLGER